MFRWPTVIPAWRKNIGRSCRANFQRSVRTRSGSDGIKWGRRRFLIRSLPLAVLTHHYHHERYSSSQTCEEDRRRSFGKGLYRQDSCQGRAEALSDHGPETRPAAQSAESPTAKTRTRTAKVDPRRDAQNLSHDVRVAAPRRQRNSDEGPEPHFLSD